MHSPHIGGFQKPEAPFFLQLSGIVGDSIVDGPGLRCTIFCQGCPHACPGCHNPSTHPFEGGTAYTPENVYNEIVRYPLCHGVTFSGGEPFCQAAALVPLARHLRSKGYNLAAYTGFTFEHLLKEGGASTELLALIDVLIDGPFVLAKRNLSLRFRGSENQRILNVPKSLKSGAAVLCTATAWIGEA